MSISDTRQPAPAGKNLYGSEVLAHSLLGVFGEQSQPPAPSPKYAEGRGWVPPPQFPDGRAPPPSSTGKVGIYFHIVPDGVQIVQLAQDGAAARSGQVRVGDTIMSINGKECANQSVDQTRFQLNGVPGTAVVLLVRTLEGVEHAAPGAPLDVSMMKTVVLVRVQDLQEMGRDVDAPTRQSYRALIAQEEEQQPQRAPAPEQPAASPPPAPFRQEAPVATDEKAARLHQLEEENNRLRQLVQQQHLRPFVEPSTRAPEPSGYLWVSVLAAHNIPSSLGFDLAGLSGYFCKVQVVARGAGGGKGEVRHSFSTVAQRGSLTLRFDKTFVVPIDRDPAMDDLFIELWEESAWGSLTRTAQTTGSNRLGFVRFPLSSLCSSVKLAPGMHDLCRQDGRGEMPPVPLQGVAPGHSAQLLLAAEYFVCKPKNPSAAATLTYL